MSGCQSGNDLVRKTNVQEFDSLPTLSIVNKNRAVV